jgi:CRISPR-associated protein Cas2
MHFVAVYDVLDDRKRLKIAELLFRYGERVQYSCFEIWVYPEELMQLVALRVQEIMDLKNDRVYFYPLSKYSRNNAIYLPDYLKKFTQELQQYFKEPRVSFNRKLLLYLEDQLSLEVKVGKVDKFLAIYDITENSVRTKLSNLLSRYGARVQKSVFELYPDPNRMAELIYKVGRYHARFGKVFFYPLDERSYGRVIRLGAKPIYLTGFDDDSCLYL